MNDEEPELCQLTFSTCFFYSLDAIICPRLEMVEEKQNPFQSRFLFTAWWQTLGEEERPHALKSLSKSYKVSQTSRILIFNKGRFQH